MKHVYLVKWIDNKGNLFTTTYGNKRSLSTHTMGGILVSVEKHRVIGGIYGV